MPHTNGCEMSQINISLLEETHASKEDGELDSEEELVDVGTTLISYKKALKEAGPELRCTCCGNVYTDPVRLPCGHLMDRNCVTLKRKFGTLLSCPMCSKRHTIVDASILVSEKSLYKSLPMHPDLHCHHDTADALSMSDEDKISTAQNGADQDFGSDGNDEELSVNDRRRMKKKRRAVRDKRRREKRRREETQRCRNNQDYDEDDLSESNYESCEECLAEHKSELQNGHSNYILPCDGNLHTTHCVPRATNSPLIYQSPHVNSPISSTSVKQVSCSGVVQHNLTNSIGLIKKVPLLSTPAEMLNDVVSRNVGLLPTPSCAVNQVCENTKFTPLQTVSTLSNNNISAIPTSLIMSHINPLSMISSTSCINTPVTSTSMSANYAHLQLQYQQQQQYAAYYQQYMSQMQQTLAWQRYMQQWMSNHYFTTFLGYDNNNTTIPNSQTSLPDVIPTSMINGSFVTNIEEDNNVIDIINGTCCNENDKEDENVIDIINKTICNDNDNIKNPAILVRNCSLMSISSPDSNNSNSALESSTQSHSLLPCVDNTSHCDDITVTKQHIKDDIVLKVMPCGINDEKDALTYSRHFVINNLRPDTKAAEIKCLCNPYGKINCIKVVGCKRANDALPSIVAYVTMESHLAANAAVQHIDGVSSNHCLLSTNKIISNPFWKK